MNTEEFMKHIETIRAEAEKSTQKFIEEVQNEYKYITTKLDELKNMKENMAKHKTRLHNQKF